MATKNKPKADPVGKSHSITLKLDSGQSEDAAMAEIAVNGAMGNWHNRQLLEGYYGELSLMACIEALTDQVKDVQNGELKNF